jgi:CDP-diacylglycerol--serine O-phosphatidyltransferase
MKVIGVYRKCDFVTMLGTCFAISGIIFTYNNKTTFAVFCLIMAAICDAFDGVVARRFRSLKEQEIYGVELDSLSDAISFGVLPMMIVLNLTIHNIITYTISIFFVLCGVIRLAYFNMLTTTKRGSKKEFIGVPITASAIIIPAVYFITGLLKSGYKEIIFPTTLLITGILFITPIKLKKPTGREKVILSVFGIIAIVITLIKIYS